MARLHRLELIGRTWRSRGGRAALAILLRSLRDSLIGQHRMIFAMTGDRALAQPDETPEFFTIARYAEWREVDECVRAHIAAQKRFVWWDVEEQLDKGAVLWVGMQNGSPVSYAHSRNGNQIDVYFFPMTETCILISHCVTVPEVRGRGYYLHILRHIGRKLAEEGCNRIYIDCSDFNFSSENGIRRAGFTEIGRGVHLRSGNILWRQKTNPSVSNIERFQSCHDT